MNCRELCCVCVLVTGCATTKAGSSSTTPTPIFSPELERDVLVAALRRARFFLNLPTAFCIVLERGWTTRNPEPELLRALGSDPPNLPSSKCPRTYGSWIVTVDSAGRPTNPEPPPGYIDPYLLQVSPAIPVVRDLVAVRISASRGTDVWTLYCEAVPKRPVYASCGVTMKGSS
jgi:hypothetical protein